LLGSRILMLQYVYIAERRASEPLSYRQARCAIQHPTDGNS